MGPTSSAQTPETLTLELESPENSPSFPLNLEAWRQATLTVDPQLVIQTSIELPRASRPTGVFSEPCRANALGALVCRPVEDFFPENLPKARRPVRHDFYVSRLKCQTSKIGWTAINEELSMRCEELYPEITLTSRVCMKLPAARLPAALKYRDMAHGSVAARHAPHTLSSPRLQSSTGRPPTWTAETRAVRPVGCWVAAISLERLSLPFKPFAAFVTMRPSATHYTSQSTSKPNQRDVTTASLLLCGWPAPCPSYFPTPASCFPLGTHQSIPCAHTVKHLVLQDQAQSRTVPRPFLDMAPALVILVCHVLREYPRLLWRSSSKHPW
ncbi:hypothetical protein N657DRAFT_479903 [Parathielavia appendiculata]|uniref:Uncharacterized protein n=1 Tax=Parathielavia appendiculata TaxID=2587402 RepID=A0AAN6TXW4_9PEZI|nr:hypothetical protein N657DRAFT_479903 [Parathielavia appendiculata]